MLRFTLRDLFWLTLLVAVSLGWWASYARYVRRLNARGRHAEALRMALENAMHNATTDDNDLLLPVDWGRYRKDDSSPSTAVACFGGADRPGRDGNLWRRVQVIAFQGRRGIVLVTKDIARTSEGGGGQWPNAKASGFRPSASLGSAQLA
jgi:hypothetical protein